jgi:ubiquinone/menaquinone biosynthesis C-methylase UbiE
MNIDHRETARTRARYQRVARLYDGMEVIAERRYQPWRTRIWSMVTGPRVLEIGVGTGKNIPYYPEGMDITAIDLTPGMLDRARKRAAILKIDANILLGDAQKLDLPSGMFDEVVETFVFCSVPDPMLGLNELLRVVKPGGRIFMLEHVRSANPAIGVLMDALNPILVRVTGANVNRRTVDNVSRSGFTLELVENLGMGDIFKLIIARRDQSVLASP